MTSWDQETFDGLGNTINIYRGTSEAELNSSPTNFGQSWTTDVKKAEYFAFGLRQEKDDSKVRVVISTMIEKKYIYAYSSYAEEMLCIVNQKGLNADFINLSKSKTIEKEDT